MKCCIPDFEIEVAAKRLEALVGEPDVEKAHAAADSVLCGLLRSAGLGEIVDLWIEVPKWYA